MAMVVTASISKHDTKKYIKINLVHDLTELTVGYITLHCGVSEGGQIQDGTGHYDENDKDAE